MSRSRPAFRPVRRIGAAVTHLVTGVGARLRLVGGAVGLIWTVEVVDQLFFGGYLDQFGVRPRSVPGLWGICFSPFLHSNFAHLVANTAPGFVLGMLVTTRRVDDFWRVTLLSGLTAGLGAWLLGASGSVHIGSSGVVFGFLGFLMARGYFERKVLSVALSLGVSVAYGSMLLGMLPVLTEVGVSWQGHLFGWVGGVWAARSIPSARRAR